MNLVKSFWSFIKGSKSVNHEETTKNETTSDLQQLGDAVKENSKLLYKSEAPSNPEETTKNESSSDLQQLCDAVKEKSQELYKSEALPVYKLPLIEEQINVKGCRWYRFGEDSRIKQKNRSIMVIGSTGAGKSTLINGMINYILGVEWECPYRFKLVHEDPSKSQAESQTSEVTVYKINHQEGFKIDYSVTIVDTPGFGDTRGIERDRAITEQLRNLFSSQRGVSEIDAVCFVAQASLARLTATQRYVFDSLLSIFGKDIAENIRVLVTFADGQRPPVLEAIKTADVPCPKTKEGLPSHFKFNNSALFANNKSSAQDSNSDDDEDGSFDEMFWNMGTKSMKRFFDALNQIQTKSLTLTKEVLKERQQLENSVEKLQEQVKVGLAKLEQIKETGEQLKEHEAEISRNENFEFEVAVMKPFQVDISGTRVYLTNCQQCHMTCHDRCGIPNDKDKHRCIAMGRDGYCKVCPGKCIWSQHFNQKYRWEYKEVKEKQTITDLKKKYDIAKEAKSPVEALIGKLNTEYKTVQDEVQKLMERSTKCLNRLKDIALRPNPLSTPDYIDMLIEGEKSEGKPGWNKRVQALMKIRDKALTMGKLVSGEKLLQHQSAYLPKSNQEPINTDTVSNKNLNDISSNANQDKAGIRTDQDKSEPNSDKTNPDSKSSQHRDLDSNMDKTESTNPDQDQGGHDINNYHIGNNTTQDQDTGNLNTDNSQDTEPDTDQDQDQDKCDADIGQDTDPDQDQDKDKCDADIGQDTDPDQDQDKDKCDADIGQDTDPDQNQDKDKCDADNGQDTDPDQDQDQDKCDADIGQDTDPDQDQDKDKCDADNGQDTDPDQDQDQDKCDADNGQDTDPDQNQDKDKCDADNGQDTDPDQNQDKDKCDADNGQDTDPDQDQDQDKCDADIGQDTDPDQDQDKDKCDADNGQDTDPDQDQDKDKCDADNGQDTDPDQDQDQDKCDADIGQDTDPDQDQDQDKCDADIGQDTDPDQDQDKCDADNGQDTDPDQDQDKCDADNGQDTDPDQDQDC